MKAATVSKAKVRLNALTPVEYEVEWEEGQSLDEIVKSVWEEYNIHPDIQEYFIVLVDGYEMHPDYWRTKPSASAEVLVAIRPKGGSGRGIFRQVAVLAVTAAAFYFAAPLGPVIAGAIAGGATIATTLALNTLMPDPMPSTGDLGYGYGSQVTDSQMYIVSGQRNKTTPYKAVPRVYGTHRMFPIVAANPYTELRVDNSTGELVQYFTAIYDFGFGPCTVTDLKIGDTSIAEFADISYNFVDLAKPEYAEGEEPEWEKYLVNDFTLYRGDHSAVTVATTLNEDRDAGAAAEDYEVIRVAPGEAEGDRAEITVLLIAPQGLDSFNTQGTSLPTSVELAIDFAEDGTEDWHSFSDFDRVSKVSTLGSQAESSTGVKKLIQPEPYYSGEAPAGYHNYVSRSSIDYTSTESCYPSSCGSGEHEHDCTKCDTTWWRRTTVTAILAKGSHTFIAEKGIAVGNRVNIRGTELGPILSIESFDAGHDKYFVGPIPQDITVATLSRMQDEWATHWLPKQAPVVYVSSLVYQYPDGGSRVTLTNNISKPQYMSVSFMPRAAGTYKVRVRRIRSYGGGTYRVINDITWSTLSSAHQRVPIKSTKRHAFLELQIRATNQLNGSLDTLSGKVSSILNTYNTTTNKWEMRESSNPAWVFADLLTGQCNKKPVDIARLDTTSLAEWAEFCDEIPATNPAWDGEFNTPRFTCNFVFDFKSTLQQVLDKVGHSSQASLNLINNQYGVLIDKRKDYPVQLFTTRNSWGFNSTRSYAEPVEALNVKYIDRNTWKIKEVTVYQDRSKPLENEPGELTAFACTDASQAWRAGRFAMAQSIHRRETMSLQVDFEHLVCTRGDFVQIAQDVMKVGGKPARVIWAEGNKIRIDSPFNAEPSTDYGYTHRPVSGNIGTYGMTITSPTTADIEGPTPSVGDIVVWGEVNRTVYDCVIKTITPSSDMSATLTLVEKADAIYDAESTGDMGSYESGMGLTSSEGHEPPKPIEELAVIANTYSCNGYRYEYYVDLFWINPVGSVYAGFEVYADNGAGYLLVETVTQIGYRYEVKESNLGKDHKFKVLAVSAEGNKISLGEAIMVSATPLPKTSPPSDVASLFLNVTNEALQIDWPPLPDCDVQEYLIRFNPTLEGTWVESIPLQRVDRRTTMATSQARTGTYLIKAIDFNGNESAVAARAVTSIPELANLNVIEETNDFPLLPGSVDRAIKADGQLVLQEKEVGGVGIGEYYSEGIYYYKQFLDLGDIYTVRLQSQIRAEGFNKGDIMSSWAKLSDVVAMSGSRFSEWDVETYVRSTDSFNVMSEWPSLAAIDRLSEGVQDNWSPWRKFTMGDFTGRIHQFKLVLKSYKPSVTPRVFDGIIKADMPDRRDVFNNLLSDINGTDILYAHPFKGPGLSPAIQVTQDDAQIGDIYKITDKTLSGCTITFYDSNGNPVGRQFDLVASGYGRMSSTTI